MKGNYYFRLTTGVLALLFLSTVSTSLYAQQNRSGGGCTDPVISDTSGPGTLCEGESATLTATHDGDGVNWYDAEVGGNLVGSGSPFDTGPLNTTTSFWAEAYNGGSGAPIPGCARVAPSNTTNSEVIAATSPWGLAFDADVDLTINTVDVYLADTNPGTIVMQLKDSALNIMEETSIAAPAGNPSTPVQFEITLDWFVPAGTDYNLVAASSPSMVREFSSGHPGFPYPIESVGTVTNGTINDNDTNPAVYYFFYNWTVTPGETCYSDRVEEVVTVNPIPSTPTGAADQEFLSGETLADLDVTGTNLTWYSDAGGVTTIPDTTPLVDGTTYYVSQTVDGCESDLLAITAHEVLGLDDDAFMEFQMAPNPVYEILTIQNGQQIDRVTVFSLLGQRLMVQKFDHHTVQLDLSPLPTGHYLVEIISEGQSIIRKISKH